MNSLMGIGTSQIEKLAIGVQLVYNIATRRTNIIVARDPVTKTTEAVDADSIDGASQSNSQKDVVVEKAPANKIPGFPEGLCSASKKMQDSESISPSVLFS